MYDKAVQYLAKKVNGNVFAGTVVWILLEVCTENFGISTAMYDVSNRDKAICTAVVFDACDQFACGFCHVFFFKLCQAIGTVSAITFSVFAKVTENICTQTVVCKAVEGHLFEAFLFASLNGVCSFRIRIRWWLP